jgi:hypothetical protein
MKGKLTKLYSGWVVTYVEDFDSKILPYSGSVSIPVHPYDKIDDDDEGGEVEFKIVYFWETGLEQVYKVAKLTKPKEEPKDVVLGYKTSLEAQMLDSKLPKQETLEEAAERLSELQEGTYTVQHKITYKHGFIDGAKWNERRCYTEEEVIEFTMNMISQYVVGNTNIWDRDRLKESLLLKKL